MYVLLFNVAEINEEVMEEQPWIWNDMKMAGALRKFNSILDVGVTDEDNDNIDDDRTAAAQTANPPKSVANFRETQKRQQQKQQRVRASGGDSLNGDADYIYDVEGRPLTAPQANAAVRPDFYVKPADIKRSQKASNGQQQQQQQPAYRRHPQLQGSSSMTSSSTSSTDGDDDISSLPQSMPVIRDVEPRVLPLLGFHTAINKINRQKEALLKKILRQAGQSQSIKHFYFYINNKTPNLNRTWSIIQLDANRWRGAPIVCGNA